MDKVVASFADECAPGFEPADIARLTEAPLVVALWAGSR
jgi:hypothetical protein